MCRWRWAIPDRRPDARHRRAYGRPAGRSADRSARCPTAVRELFLTDVPDDFDELSRHRLLGRRRRLCLGAGDARFRRSRHSPWRDPARPCRGGRAWRADDATPGLRSAPRRLAPRNTRSSFPARPAPSPRRARSLPRRSLQVLKPDIDLATAPAAARDRRRRSCDHFEAFDLDPAHHEAVLAFEFDAAPEYARIRAPCRRHRTGDAAPDSTAGHRLYVMIDGDIAQTLGGILRDEIRSDERSADPRRHLPCAISTISTWAKSACRLSPCRSRSSRCCSRTTRAARAGRNASSSRRHAARRITPSPRPRHPHHDHDRRACG